MRLFRPRVPASDGDIYLFPESGVLRDAVNGNIRLMGAYRARLCGIPAPELRAQSRRELLRRAIEYSSRLGFGVPRAEEGLIVQTGHQPALYHPGVWIKNHFCFHLAKALGGTGVNVIVDNDAPKGIVLKLPVIEGERGSQEHLLVARTRPGVAYQEYGAGALATREITEEVLRRLPSGEMRASFAAFAGILEERSRDLADMVSALTAARHDLEERMGVSNLEVPVSVISATHSFAVFAVHILLNIEAFAEAYNESLGEYRRLYRVRYASNPLPDLRAEGGFLEAPFWVWRRGEPRQPLTVRRLPGGLGLYLGEERVGTLGREMVSDAEAASAAVRNLLSQGLRLQPRALTMTMFLRLFASDIFIHGIGGAKYDVVTDEIVARFFGEEAPQYVTLSATVLLPLKTRSTLPSEVRELRRHLRDLRWNPDRHAVASSGAGSELQALAIQKRRLIGRSPAGDGERQERFRRIRALNERMTRFVQKDIEAAATRLDEAEANLRYNEIMRDRDYPFILYPNDLIEKLSRDSAGLLEAAGFSL